MSIVDNVNSEAQDAFSAEERQLFEAMENGDVDLENLPQLPGGDDGHGDGGEGDGGDDRFVQPEILAPGQRTQQQNDQDPELNDDGSPRNDADVETVVDQAGKKRGRVSFQKFAKVQAEQQALQERLQALQLQSETDKARLSERLAIINEALTTPGQRPGEQQQQQAAEDPAPDPTENIFEYSQWQGRQLKKLQEDMQRLQTGVNQSEESRQFERAYSADVNAFARAEKNFAPAVQHLANARHAQLQIVRPDLDEKGRLAIIAREERSLVQNCLQENASPAKRLYELALAYGYKPAAAPQPDPSKQGGQQQGQADPQALDQVARRLAQGGQQQPAQRQPAQRQQPAAPAPAPHLGPAADPAATIAAIQNGQQANMSLSQMGGGAPIQLTADAVLGMSDDQFGQLVEQLSEAKLRELMGD